MRKTRQLINSDIGVCSGGDGISIVLSICRIGDREGEKYEVCVDRDLSGRRVV